MTHIKPFTLDTSKGIKILSIGNSFSEDAHRYLYQILIESGIPKDKVIVANMYIGGASLKMHVDHISSNAKAYTYQLYKNVQRVDFINVSLKEAISYESWDIITFQQASHDSGITSTYQHDLERLTNWVLKHATNKDVKLGFHMTWSYEQTSLHPGFINYNNNQRLMYESIINAVKKEVLKLEKIDFIIPCASAIENARTTYIGDHLTRDGFHLNEPLGRYIASLTFYEAITGSNKTTFKPDGMTSKDQKTAFMAVSHACHNPFYVTDLSSI